MNEQRATEGGVRHGWICRTAVAALLLASLGLSSGAAAQTLDSASREAATTLFVAGLESYEAGAFAEALDKLDKSYSIARVPTLGLWSARALVKLGRLREAEDRYREAISLPLPEGDRQTQQQAVSDAQAEVNALGPKIPTLVISIEGARPEDVQLSIDGKAADLKSPQRLDPGTHHVEALRGNAHQTLDLELAAGDTRSMVLHFTPAPMAAAPASVPMQQQPNHWLRPAAWTSIAVGGVGMSVGTVALFLMLQKKDDMNHNLSCKGVRCPPSQSDLVDSYNSRRTLSTVGYVAGGALVAFGVGALVIGGHSSEDPRAEAVVSPNFTGVRGSF